MGMQMVSACVCPQASLQCRCVASLWERARTTPERRDMGRALEAETGPYRDRTVSGVGRALARFYYVMLCYALDFVWKSRSTENHNRQVS